MVTNETVVIKIVDKRKAIGSKRKKAVLDELNMLKVKHPAIIELKDFFVTKDYLVLVLEFCAGGDLFARVTEKRGLREVEAKCIFKQILEGINYLHKLNIIHRDIKLENILIKEKGGDDIKISDFGMSRIVSRVHLATTQCGTTEYTAPEVFLMKPYGTACDCWSLGILLYDMLSQETPFRDVDDIILSEKTGVPFVQPVWSSISEEAKDLITSLLCFDPDERWGCEQALQAPWFDTIDNSDSSVEPAELRSPKSISSPTTGTSKKRPNHPVPFKMNLRKNIKVKHPYNV